MFFKKNFFVYGMVVYTMNYVYKQRAYLKCKPLNNAFAYNITMVSILKNYTCIAVHDFYEYWLKIMDNQQDYYFYIEAINEK